MNQNLCKTPSQLTTLPFTLSHPISAAAQAIEAQQYAKAMNHLIDFFEIKKLDVFSEKNKAIDSFYQVNEAEFIKFLTKYKNLKSSKEMKGKITESEISSLIKKYKKK